MPRELPNYRETLADLRGRYGDVDVIRIGEFAKRNKVPSETVRRRYQLPKDTQYIELTTLAHKICELART